METRNLRASLSLKLFIIGFLTLLLMIPTGMIAMLVDDREGRQAEAFREVSEKWGLEQTVVGPVLTVPYLVQSETQVDGQARVVEQTRYAHFLPEILTINGQVMPETRQRGLYEVAVYSADLDISGEFSAPDFSDWEINPDLILLDKAFVSLGLPDLRGIRDNVVLNWNNNDYAFSPGLETKDVMASGMQAKIDLNPQNQASHRFSLNLKTNGSRDLMFVPVGRTTNVSLSSDWPAPSFQGAFLPEYELSDSGFTAKWQVLELNRSFSQKFLGSAALAHEPVLPDYRAKPTSQSANLYGSDFGVRLLIPADEYQQTVRALKYAIMLLALTFLVLFFYEAKKSVRVHPMQYILIGLALTIFYVLLLSLAEYIGFDWAYMIATAAVTILITLYCKAIFQTWRPAGLQTLLLLFIYTFIYVILQLEDYALLVGSIGLFAILAAVMYVSRGIDWYGLGKD